MCIHPSPACPHHTLLLSRHLCLPRLGSSHPCLVLCPLPSTVPPPSPQLSPNFPSVRMGGKRASSHQKCRKLLTFKVHRKHLAQQYPAYLPDHMVSPEARLSLTQSQKQENKKLSSQPLKSSGSLGVEGKKNPIPPSHTPLL